MNTIRKYFKLIFFSVFTLTVLFPKSFNINGKRGIWKHYLTVDGITSNYIYGVSVDNNNSIWLSTSSGVTHINGLTFSNYGYDSGLPPSNISNILMLSSGEIVAVSETNGALKLDNGTFTEISGLYGKNIYTSSIDSDGNLVVTTEKGVFTHKGGKYNSLIKIGSKIITAIDISEQGNWYGGKGMVYFDNGTLLKEYDLTEYTGQSKITSISGTGGSMDRHCERLVQSEGWKNNKCKRFRKIILQSYKSS